LPDSSVFPLLDLHVPASTCKPNQLWKLKSVTAQGQTSDWEGVKKGQSLLSALFEVTKGRQLTMTPFNLQIDRWLRQLDPPKAWSLVDIQNSTDWLRCMIRSLVAMKKKPPHRPPMKHGDLQPLLDKIDLMVADEEIIMQNSEEEPHAAPVPEPHEPEVAIVSAESRTRRRRLARKQTSDASLIMMPSPQKPVDWENFQDDLFDEDFGDAGTSSLVAAAEIAGCAPDSGGASSSIVVAGAGCAPESGSASAALLACLDDGVHDSGLLALTDTAEAPADLAVAVPPAAEPPAELAGAVPSAAEAPAADPLATAGAIPKLAAVPKQMPIPISEAYAGLTPGMDLADIYKAAPKKAPLPGLTPTEYRTLQVKIKDKKKKGKGKKGRGGGKKGRGRGKTGKSRSKKEKGECARPAASVVITAKRREGLNQDDPIYAYLDYDGKTPSKQIMRERIRSKAYNPEFAQRKANGEDRDVCLHHARLAGSKAITRWTDKMRDA
jgi:hypothetical protein